MRFRLLSRAKTRIDLVRRRRGLMVQVLAQLTDELAEIRPSGTNTWTATTQHPVTNAAITIPNLRVNANELIVYVGAQNFNSSQIGLGGPGGFQGSGSQAWLNTLASRGQAAALASRPTDFGPWGGVMSFSSTANWYVGTNSSGLGAGQFDFMSVASHEFMHVLGFGTSASRNNLVSGSQFTGANARAAYDAGYQAAAGSITILGDEPPAFQNPDDAFDVDGDMLVQPLEALRILAFIRQNGSGRLTAQTQTDGLFVDVNGDGEVIPLDALLVLREIGQRGR